jgi:predicted ATPase/class 3 adenylate cyclase
MVSDLPTGTVTFLFTDIEGSTRLLRQLGDGYRAVQDRHAEVVRAAIDGHGGREVRTEGDSFFVAFDRAPNAAAAAADIQRALATEPWAHGEPLRVRIGIHTGEGILGGGDYVGIDVHRAARIAAAGHGGQVLLSDATRALLGDAVPDGVRIRGLGRHALRDFDEPQPLHDLVIDGLPADFPPVRTLRGGPAAFPAPRTSFIGRERELEEVAELLGRSRLVTLTGPGGTGKTRLAIGVAAEAVARFRDGAFLVDLSAVTDPAVVPSKIATALGVRLDPLRAPGETLADHLREREALLVLDNLEQVIGSAEDVGRLLDDSPGLRVLATSRVPLRLSGEHEYRVEPLPLPDPASSGALERLGRCESVMLFVDRAAAVRRGFRLTEENAAAIAGIVDRVDGLPLAIELAASRVRALGPRDLLDRLDQRLPVLAGGAHDLPARQRTLRDAIAWSHDLLGAAEQRLFARLSVFSGGFTLGSAEAVCGPGLELEVMEGIEALVEHSLLQREERGGRVRYRMLETVREFATGRLDASGEADEVRRRHAEGVITLVEEAEPKLLSDRASFDRLGEEHDNIRAALGWTIGRGEADLALRIVGPTWRFWQLRNQLAEGRQWTQAAIALPAAAGRTAARARALGALGSLAYYLRDPEHVRGPYEESLAISRELEDPLREAEAAYNLAFARVLEGDLRGARDLLLRSEALYRDLGDPVPLAHATAALGHVAMEEGDLDGAEGLIEDARETFRAARQTWGVVLTSGQLATIALRRGDLDRARTETFVSLDGAIDMGGRDWAAVALQALAVLAIRGEDPERGVRLAGASARLREEAGGEAPAAVVGLEDPLELASHSLPGDRIDVLWEEGRSMDWDEALAYARQEA